jgi:superfamily I DNA and/or RNA helicase
MSVQYRMRSPIAEVIGTAFYKRPRLESHPSVDQRHHGLVSPRFLADGCPLVWLDTYQLPGYEETTNWENKGEAVLVRDFLYKLDPFPQKSVPPFTRDPLAIITPYRMQNNRIRKLLRGEGEVPPSFPVSSSRRSEIASLTDPDVVHSVHSIQGREADVVVSSLVRTGQGGNTVFSAMGHVAEETLINVLFSRARLLLVLIGDFDFFQRAAELYPSAAFWGDVCNAVLQHGRRITAEELYASR